MSDHQYRRASEVETPDGSTIRFEKPGIAVWVTYSGHDSDGNMAWFTHFEDRITVKNPDEEIRSKMCRIAMTLGANVQCNEGERYDENGQPGNLAEDDSSSRDHPTKPWWRFWN